MDDQGFGDRLQAAIEKLGGMRPAAEVAGVSTDQLAKWRALKARASFPALAAVAQRAAVSLDWLAFGTVPAEHPTGDDYAEVRRYAVKASAGGGIVPFNEDPSGTLAFRREWLRRIGLNPDLASVIEAEGDSMEPTICDGDPLLLDHSITDIRNGLIYALNIRGELLVKRVQVRADGCIVLISDNPKYEREVLPENKALDLHVVGRVKWVGRSL